MNGSSNSLARLKEAFKFFEGYNFPIDQVNDQQVLVMDSRLYKLIFDVYVTKGEGYKVAKVAIGHLEVLSVHSSFVECEVNPKIPLHDPLLNSSSQVSSVGGASSSAVNNPNFFRINLPSDYAERATSSGSGGARFPAILETMFPVWDIRRRALQEIAPPNSIILPDPVWSFDEYSWLTKERNELEEEPGAWSWSAEDQNKLEELVAWSAEDQNKLEELEELETYMQESDAAKQLLVSSAISEHSGEVGTLTEPVASSSNTLTAETRDVAVSVRAELAVQIVPARAERVEPVAPVSNLPGEVELLSISSGGSVSPVEPPPAGLFGKFIAVTVLAASLAFVGYVFMAFLNVYTTQTFNTAGNTLADISHSTRIPKWLTSTCETLADWCLAKSSFFSSQEVIFTTNLSKLFNGFLTVQGASTAWAFVFFAIVACGLIIYYLKAVDNKKQK